MLFANRLSQEGKDEVVSLSFPITVLNTHNDSLTLFSIAYGHHW